MPCLIDTVGPEQQHGRHEEDNHEQGAKDGFRHDIAEIRSQLEAHQRQRQETEQRGQRAGQHRIDGVVQALLQGRNLCQSVLTLTLIGMKQEYGIVHGRRQLQHITDVVGDEGNLAEEDIGSLVQRDGRADDCQEQHRFEVAGGGEEQDNEDDHHGDGHDHGHLGLHVFLDELLGGRHAHDIALVPDEILNVVNGLLCPFGGIALLEGDIHNGTVVLVVILYVIIVDELRGGIDLGRGVAPDHLVHTVDLLQLVLVFLGLIQTDVLQHETAGTRIAEDLLHFIDGDLRYGGIGKVGGQIIVDTHKKIADQVEYNQDQRNVADSLVVINDKICQIPTFFLLFQLVHDAHPVL